MYLNNLKKIKIKNNVEIEKFEEFLLNLSKESQIEFNHFGIINKKTAHKIIHSEFNRKDKIKFFSVLDGKVVGYSFLIKFSKSTKKHNCTLGIIILDQFQNIGIGKKMCTHMIKKAWNKGFTKIWLNVFFDNVRAFKMYKSLGFQIEGIFIDDEIYKNKKRHVISMALIKNKSYNFSKRIKLIKKLDSNQT